MPTPTEGDITFDPGERDDIAADLERQHMRPCRLCEAEREDPHDDHVYLGDDGRIQDCEHATCCRTCPTCGRDWWMPGLTEDREWDGEYTETGLHGSVSPARKACPTCARQAPDPETAGTKVFAAAISQLLPERKDRQ